MTVVNHWGKWVDSDQPVGGVVSIHNVTWINDEVSGSNAIDLSWEEYQTQWHADRLAKFQHDHGYDRLPSKSTLRRWEAQFSEEAQYYEANEQTYLIGAWVKDDSGKYAPDPSGEYSAIVAYDGFMCAQVVLSKWVIRGALCSPCFPGQVDLDSEGDYLGYDLPSDLYGESRQNSNAPLRWLPDDHRAIDKEGDSIIGDQDWLLQHEDQRLQDEIARDDRRFPSGATEYRLIHGRFAVAAQRLQSGAMVLRSNVYSDFTDRYTHLVTIADQDDIAAILAQSDLGEPGTLDRDLLDRGMIARFTLPVARWKSLGFAPIA